MKQPVSGIFATVTIIALSWLIVSLFDFVTFTTWTAWLFMCAIPAQVLVGVTWSASPTFAAGLAQPVKGLVLSLVTVAIGCVVAAIVFFTVGGGVMPPAPMLVVYTILTVIVMFWLAIMFGGWPFANLVKLPTGAGALMLLACYGLSYLVFQVFFDFGFMRGAPVYVAALDPAGMFNANHALVFSVTAIAVLFLLLHFDLWPLATVPALMSQPLLGLAWTVLSVVVGGAAMYVGVVVASMDPMLFMVRGPIPLIFGTIVVLNMLQNSLFASLIQPLKGFCNTVVAIVLGALLAALYGLFAPLLTGPLTSGAPGNDYERWLASALLGITFPLLILFVEFFRLWPLTGKPHA